MNQDHYLNYAVWQKVVNGRIEPTLIKATDGYFASKAWKISDEAYAQIAGSKFGGLFGDDGTKSWVSKYDVSRLSSDKEFEQLYNASHVHFKVLLKVLDILDEEQKKLTDIIAKVKVCQNVCEFESYASAWFTNLHITEMPSDTELRMIADCVLRN